MALTAKEIQSKRIIAELELKITNAIDDICSKYDYKVTYSEINKALTERLSRNLKQELDDYYKEEEE